MYNLIGAAASYTISLNKLPDIIKSKLLLDNIITTDLEYVTLCQNIISKYNIPESAIIYDTFNFDEELIYDYLKAVIGEYNNYLTYQEKCTIHNIPGYKIHSELERTPIAVDASAIYVAKEYDNKAIKLIVSSHDYPTGVEVCIIGLSDKEFDKLNDASFDKIQEFINNICE